MLFETGDYVKMGTKESSLWGRVVWTTSDGYRARVDFKTFTADVVADDIITARRKQGDKLARGIVAKTLRYVRDIKKHHYRHNRFLGYEKQAAANISMGIAKKIDMYELYLAQRKMLEI